MTQNMREIAGMLIERAAAAGGDKLLEEAGVLLAYFSEAGQEYVIRKDYAGENLGVTYTHPDMIGAVVRMYDTGRRAQA